VRQAGSTLATNVQRVYGEAQNYMDQLNSQFTQQVQRVNTLASQVATLNNKIAQIKNQGDPANDLSDQRDQALEELSKLGRLGTFADANGRVVVTLGGHTLVGTQGASEMKVQVDANGDKQAVWADDQSVVTARDGELGATSTLRDWTRNQIMSGLDKLASNIISSVNTLHSAAYTADGRTTINFFAGTGAADIRISDTVAGDLSAIAIAAGPNSPGDSSVALKIANLQQASIPALGDSITGYYASYIAQFGLDIQKSEQMASSQKDLVSFLSAQRESIAGVSLDEEATYMLGAQRSYQASARVITAVDQMLQTIINGMGEAGR
jgi:flagellar hook-associated protein 1